MDPNWCLPTLIHRNPLLCVLEVTANFEAGMIGGTGGCSTYNGPFTLGEDNPFVVKLGPIVATQMMCDQPIADQEATYFTALENASQWGYVVGKLAITYVLDAELAAPPEPPDLSNEAHGPFRFPLCLGARFGETAVKKCQNHVRYWTHLVAVAWPLCSREERMVELGIDLP